MRICLHTIWEINEKYIGGTERFLINLSKELLAFGYQPFIVCSSKQEEIFVEGIQVLGRFGKDNRLSKYPYFSSALIKNEIIGDSFTIDSIKRLSEYVDSQLDGIDADVFHLNSFISAAFVDLKKKIVVTNHENDKEYDWYWGNGFFDFFKQLVAKQATNIHQIENLYCPSDYYANFFSKEFDLPIKAIHLGVPLIDFKYSPKENSLKQEYSFDTGEALILLPSRFQPFQKGHDIALKAGAILKEKGISFKMIFTGVKRSSEKYLTNFDELVKELNLQKHVKVITFPDINEAYRNIDIIISPERYCSYGLSISEALSLGIPTVLSDIPTYTEIASKYKHAYFFKSESSQDMADKLMHVIAGTTRNRKEAIKFRKDYDLRSCAKAYSDIYETL